MLELKFLIICKNWGEITKWKLLLHMLFSKSSKLFQFKSNLWFSNTSFFIFYFDKHDFQILHARSNLKVLSCLQQSRSPQHCHHPIPPKLNPKTKLLSLNLNSPILWLMQRGIWSFLCLVVMFGWSSYLQYNISYIFCHILTAFGANCFLFAALSLGMLNGSCPLQSLLVLLLCFHPVSCCRSWLVLYTTTGGQCYQLSCIYWCLCLVCSLGVVPLNS